MHLTQSQLHKNDFHLHREWLRTSPHGAYAELQGILSGDGEATWKGAVRMHKPGVYEYGFRIYPKHPLLAHRQDFTLIKWV